MTFSWLLAFQCKEVVHIAKASTGSIYTTSVPPPCGANTTIITNNRWSVTCVVVCECTLCVCVYRGITLKYSFQKLCINNFLQSYSLVQPPSLLTTFKLKGTSYHKISVAMVLILSFPWYMHVRVCMQVCIYARACEILHFLISNFMLQSRSFHWHTWMVSLLHLSRLKLTGNPLSNFLYLCEPYSSNIITWEGYFLSMYALCYAYYNHGQWS